MCIRDRFYRAKGELTLTPAGELYVKAAEQVIHIQKDLYKEISSLDQKGHIMVGVTSQFALRMLSDIIPKFKKQYPEVTIEISETNPPNLTKMLVEENLDLGIMAAISKAPFEDQMDILRTEEVYFAIPVDLSLIHIYKRDLLFFTEFTDHGRQIIIPSGTK